MEGVRLKIKGIVKTLTRAWVSHPDGPGIGAKNSKFFKRALVPVKRTVATTGIHCLVNVKQPSMHFWLNSTNQIVHRSRLVLSNPYSPSPSLPGSYNILIMRWSLILSTFLTVLSTFSAALVIPTSESLVDLKRRAGSANLKASSSKNYYENHNSAYEFDHTGAETHLIFFFFN